MAHTTLGRLKRHVLNQIQLPHGKYKPEFKEYSSDIKKRLVYDGLIETLGELHVVHVGGTKTVLLSRSVCEEIVRDINGVVSEDGLVVNHLPISVYQKRPSDVSTSYKLESISDLKELMGKVHDNTRHHQLKKTNKLKVKSDKRAGQYRSAVKLLDEVRQAITNGDKMVCIDVEAFEFNQNILLEIGITTFIEGAVTTRHLIIEERLKTINKRYVPNHKHDFLFGDSEIVPLTEAMHIVKQQLKGCKRLVGHSVSGDVEWLAKHGVKFNSKNRYFDTSFLSKAVINSGKPRLSLKDVCEACGIEMQFAHNGGNDSHYNMLAVLELAKMTPFKQVE